MESPYNEYKNNKLWKIIDTSIKDLIKNKDITETTNHDYIVGYIVKKVVDTNLK